MKESSRLETTIELLALAEKEPKPSDSVISAYFRERRFIGSKDRSAIASRVYALLRHHARLKWWVEYSSPLPSGGAGGGLIEERVSPVLPTPLSPPEGRGNIPQIRKTVLVYLGLVEKREAKEIATLFEGGKYAPAPLNPEEKEFLKKLEGRTLSHPEMPEATRLECSEWAYEKLKTALGADFEKEMQAMLSEAPLDLRVNILKATREQVLEALEKEDIRAAASPLSPLGIRVQGRPAIAQLEIFKQGWIEIQDEGSQLVAVAVDAKPGMSVVDFCAGAGGKTLAIAASMNNKGRVIACDVLGGRLKRARERFRRAGLHNIEVRELSSETDDWVKRNAGKHDRVLVDAPCSGTGVWRRNPDARWKNLGPGLAELTSLQARILSSASRLVKPGGKLVYATCSLLPEENEGQVENFLKANAEFTRIPLPSGGVRGGNVGNTRKNFSYGETVPPPCPLTEGGGYLKLTSARHGTDGFFAALLARK